MAKSETGAGLRPPFLTRVFQSLARGEAKPMSSPAPLIGLCRALMSERGEVAGARLAVEVIAAYELLAPEAREGFFDVLAGEFSVDAGLIDRAADAYREDRSAANLIQLQAVTEASRQELFRRINIGAGGTQALIRMRRHILQTVRQHPDRIGLDSDLLHLFKSWFNRGFLVLKPIDWRTSALVLERLIEYEAVHQIHGWSDLHRRLESDRRCYAFFHPALPDEPLIFIEVALTRGLSARVQPLLDPDSVVLDARIADTAVFYSITNCQEGLRGISFGNFLIKQVVEDLGKELTNLKTFATLSPIPGFAQWLRASKNIDRSAAAKLPQDEITRLCAVYLLRAKKGNMPADPVARFHLANGARLERLNWMGDTSAAGMERALGLTANYVYRLADVERNHEAYARDFQVVASPALERLAKRSRNAEGSTRSGDA